MKSQDKKATRRSFTFLLPDIGEGVDLGHVEHLHVEVGDSMVVHETVLEVVTDKAMVEIPNPYENATLTRYHVVKDQDVRVGDELFSVEADETVEQLVAQDRTRQVAAGLGWIVSDIPKIMFAEVPESPYDFAEVHGHAQRVVLLARQLFKKPLGKLDPARVKSLEEVLFDISAGFKGVRRFSRQLDQLTLKLRSLTYKKLLRELVEGGHEREERFRQAIEEARQDWGEYKPGRKNESEAIVFVSHAREDLGRAKLIEEELKLRKIECHALNDASSTFGDDILTVVHDAISRATHVVSLISRASLNAEWVAYEAGFARSRGVRVVPYVIEREARLPGYVEGLSVIREEAEFEKFCGFLQRYKRSGSSH